MTPRKELFISIRDKLGAIEGMEYVDLHRNQFGPGKENYPQYYTACLIRIASIQWETMVEQKQEGNAVIEVILYTKDGFADQHYSTDDDGDGLKEIDLIDTVAENLQFLYGTQFKPLQQTGDETEETDIDGLMAHKLTFTALVYKITAPRYQTKRITIS
jgi:hypothetical protein